MSGSDPKDLQSALQSGVAQGRSCTSAGLAVATGSAAKSSAKGLRARDLAAKQAACHRVFEMCKTVWDVTDAARFGNPAVELQGGLLWAVGLGAAALPPMVPHPVSSKHVVRS